ncbi:hypothetical protein GOP47_0028012 [Adiantum capillus-veneris]|nr:hypothetical protein GOP47_0028012 [Adiantum capillus-veneris]
MAPASPDSTHGEPQSDESRSSQCHRVLQKHWPAGRKLAGRRQILFAKRRKRLLKQARQLSILCDAEVAVIVFNSTTGRLSHYASSSMPRIFEQYQHCLHLPDLTSPQEAKVELECQTEEASDSRKQVGHGLADLESHLKLENLDSLSIKELQKAESSLEAIQHRIYDRKNDLFQMYTQEIASKVIFSSLFNGYFFFPLKRMCTRELAHAHFRSR